MSQKNLITKAQLEEVKTAQSLLADNLYAHANASLSAAHGILLYYLPHPSLDANGNDVSFYADDHGDRVGYYQMRLTFNNVNYFAPLEVSTLPGKDPLTNVIDASGETVVAPAVPGGTAWVTDFTPEDTEDVIVTNDSLLLPHTQLGHWETHTGGIYQILSQAVYDNAGHKVSNYIARVVVDGAELWIPCDTRLGGPIQPVRLAFPGLTTFLGSNHNICEMGRDNTQEGSFWFNFGGATLPYTFTWQLNTYAPLTGAWGPAYKDPGVGLGSWVDIPSSPSTGNLPGGSPYVGTYEHVPPNKIKITVSVGNSKRVVATVRCKFTNAAGTHYSNMGIFYANDEDGSWIFSDPDENQTHYYAAITNDPPWVDGFYTWP